jgi:hypothetical protein
MPSPDYYRKQAQLFAQLALASRDPSVIGRYNTMALEYLAKAAELDRDEIQPTPDPGEDDASDMDRD